MDEKNKESKFTNDVLEMVTATFEMLDIRMEKMTEVERQIIAAFSFGMINGAALDAGTDSVTVQGTMVGVLIGKFGYSEKQAMDFMQLLIESTNREFHPTMHAIIHRGLEGYHDYKVQKFNEVHENLADILDTVVNSNN